MTFFQHLRHSVRNDLISDNELSYAYADSGRLATRTNARGIVTTYAYDDWGQLLAIDYADTTPDIAYTYDAMGRQTSATDAAGITTFTYDAFGQLLFEQVSGLYSKTLTRHYDTFGRNVGYSVDGDSKQIITYDSATGRIAESDGFRWEYLAGSNLKSQLTYPNDAVVTWSYEPHRDLLTAVTNATYSTYVYTNDLLGRRTSKNDEQYGYNVRDELIFADNVSYAYDDIIDDFAPQYDADGNQTFIKTDTGTWSVLYNAENRPIRWTQGDTVITMAFDRMGRRVEMRTVKDGAETFQHFVYDNYLCIQQLRGAENTLFHSYVWDPTEPIATRPLIFIPSVGETTYYFHDGNKNVSDLVSLAGDVVVHYAYTPFGTPIASAPSENPLAFSSEYYDFALGYVYYNYRHYDPVIGRWLQRDPLAEMGGINLFSFLPNAPLASIDVLGKQAGDPPSYLNGLRPTSSEKVNQAVELISEREKTPQAREDALRRWLKKHGARQSSNIRAGRVEKLCVGPQTDDAIKKGFRFFSKGPSAFFLVITTVLTPTSAGSSTIPWESPSSSPKCSCVELGGKEVEIFIGEEYEAWELP